jgi:hypothetical protein
MAERGVIRSAHTALGGLKIADTPYGG